jgi:hypothetical protein
MDIILRTVQTKRSNLETVPANIRRRRHPKIGRNRIRPQQSPGLGLGYCAQGTHENCTEGPKGGNDADCMVNRRNGKSLIDIFQSQAQTSEESFQCTGPGSC